MCIFQIGVCCANLRLCAILQRSNYDAAHTVTLLYNLLCFAAKYTNEILFALFFIKCAEILLLPKFCWNKSIFICLAVFNAFEWRYMITNWRWIHKFSSCGNIFYVFFLSLRNFKEFRLIVFIWMINFYH